MDKLVSVIIPAYNHQNYIVECIESVLNQTYTNIQLIVINDGSKDNTAEVVRNYINENNLVNIEFFSNHNQGLCKTLNFGIKKSKGDYIAILASDDSWLPRKIEEQISLLESNIAIGLVYSDAYIIGGNVKTTHKYSDYKPSIKKKFLNSIQNVNVYKSLLIENFVLASTVLMRKSVIDNIGDFDVNLLFEDYDMWLRITKKYPISYIDQPLGYYRMHNSNMSNSKKIMLKGTRQILSKHLNDESTVGKPRLKLMIYIRFYFRSIINLYMKNKLQKEIFNNKK
jgi:glycosyltransferase involved in cell wall biosynthesis